MNNSVEWQFTTYQFDYKNCFSYWGWPDVENDRASIGCLQHSFDLTTCRAHAVAFAPEGYNEKPRKPLKGQSWEPSVNGCDLQAAKHGVFQVYWLLTESNIDWSLEPEITTLHWLFQVDDSKSLYEHRVFPPNIHLKMFVWGSRPSNNWHTHNFIGHLMILLSGTLPLMIDFEDYSLSRSGVKIFSTCLPCSLLCLGQIS